MESSLYPIGRTENNAPTFTTSNYPPLDLYFLLVRNIKQDMVEDLMSESWAVDPGWFFLFLKNNLLKSMQNIFNTAFIKNIKKNAF